MKINALLNSWSPTYRSSNQQAQAEEIRSMGDTKMVLPPFNDGERCPAHWGAFVISVSRSMELLSLSHLVFYAVVLALLL